MLKLLGNDAKAVRRQTARSGMNRTSSVDVVCHGVINWTGWAQGLVTKGKLARMARHTPCCAAMGKTG